MTKSFALGYVIYNPTNCFRVRLAMLEKLDYEVFLFDNSPQNGVTREFVKNIPKVRYFTAGNNVGLGIGMSVICAQAFYAGFSQLLFFDQDTSFDSKTIEFVEYFSCNYPDFASTHSAVTFSADKCITETGQLVQDVMLTINSGSLFYLGNCERIGWHNQKYFVDCVDYEFCFRSLLAGLRLGKNNATPGFDHSSEQGDIMLNVFGRNVPARKYQSRRVADKVAGSLSLLFAAIVKKKLLFFYSIARSLAIYIFIQFIVRIREIGKSK